MPYPWHWCRVGHCIDRSKWTSHSVPHCPSQRWENKDHKPLRGQFSFRASQRSNNRWATVNLIFSQRPAGTKSRVPSAWAHRNMLVPSWCNQETGDDDDNDHAIMIDDAAAGDDHCIIIIIIIMLLLMMRIMISLQTPSSVDPLVCW